MKVQKTSKLRKLFKRKITREQINSNIAASHKTAPVKTPGGVFRK